MATTQFPDKSKEGQNENASSNEGQQQAGNFDNPQSGESWSNYQTKELSGNQGSVSEEEVREAFENDDRSSSAGS